MTPPVLLLPGTACDARLWAPQVEFLREHGVRSVVGEYAGAETMADMARDFLKQAPEEFALAGLSMGGIAALEIWRQAPERILGIALLNTNPQAETEERRLWRNKNLQRVLDGELETMMRRDFVPLYFSAEHAADPERVETVVAMALDCGVENYRRQSDALAGRADSVATLGTIDIPALVLCGREDKICPVSFHELMAERISTSELAVLDDCAHLSTLDQPEAVNRALADWLKRCG